MRSIGILGGMGPFATATLYLEIVRIFQMRHGARLDADYPPMWISSLPVPDVVERVEDEKRFVDMLRQGARRLRVAGADFLLIACNTAQKYLPDVIEASSLPCIDLVEEVADTLTLSGHSRAGLLGTQATLEQGTYAATCKRRGIELVLPGPRDQTEVTRVILDVLAGTPPQDLKGALWQVVDRLHDQGAEAVILGCTELPLVLRQGDAPVDLVDTIQVLAEAAVREARATRTRDLLL